MGNSHSLCHSTKQSSRIHFAQHDGFSFLGLAHSLKTFSSCKMARCTQAFNSTELAPKTQQNPFKGNATSGLHAPVADFAGGGSETKRRYLAQAGAEAGGTGIAPVDCRRAKQELAVSRLRPVSSHRASRLRRTRLGCCSALRMPEVRGHSRSARTGSDCRRDHAMTVEQVAPARRMRRLRPGITVRNVALKSADMG